MVSAIVMDTQFNTLVTLYSTLCRLLNYQKYYITISGSVVWLFVQHF